MKHLRRFNEGLKDELQDFCDTYLAYLLDNGFYNYIDPGYRDYKLRLTKGYTDTKVFAWYEISDHFIPFLYMLNKYYNLDNTIIVFKRDTGETDEFSVEDVLEKNFSYNFVDNSKSKNVRTELGLKVSKSYIRTGMRSVVIKNIKIK
jgi:hypothetical protein